MGEVDRKKNRLTHLFVKCEYVHKQRRDRRQRIISGTRQLLPPSIAALADFLLFTFHFSPFTEI
jgi:hypothetical protein